MIKRSLIAVLTLSLISFMVSFAPKSAEAKPIEIINLSKRNTLAFRGVVNGQSSAKLQVQLMEMSRKLPPNVPIYLVLDTPGGSVDAGMELIDAMNALPNKVVTISMFAASMGFHIAQASHQRLVLPSSTLMSHRASVSGVSGELPGDLIVRINFILRDLLRIDELAAKRMRMSVKDYQHAIRDELWLKGQESVDFRAADKVVLARCDASFKGSILVEIGNFFGIQIMGKMSQCPLITGVLGISTSGKAQTEEQQRTIDDIIKTYLNDKSSFVSRYIVTGKLILSQK